MLFPASPSVNMIYAFLLGLVWGLIPLKGFLGLALFAAFSAGLIYVWFTALQVRVNIIKCFILFDFMIGASLTLSKFFVNFLN